MKINNKVSFKGFQEIEYVSNNPNIKGIRLWVNNKHGKNDFDEFKSLAHLRDDKNKVGEIVFTQLDTMDEDNNRIEAFSYDGDEMSLYKDEYDEPEIKQGKEEFLTSMAKLLKRIKEADKEEFAEYYLEKEEQENLLKNNSMVLFDEEAEAKYLKEESNKINKNQDSTINDGEIKSVLKKEFDMVNKFKKVSCEMAEILNEQLINIFNA